MHIHSQVPPCLPGCAPSAHPTLLPNHSLYCRTQYHHYLFPRSILGLPVLSPFHPVAITWTSFMAATDLVCNQQFLGSCNLAANRAGPTLTSATGAGVHSLLGAIRHCLLHRGVWQQHKLCCRGHAWRYTWCSDEYMRSCNFLFPMGLWPG